MTQSMVSVATLGRIFAGRSIVLPACDSSSPEDGLTFFNRYTV